jgi:hypothetical protein
VLILAFHFLLMLHRCRVVNADVEVTGTGLVDQFLTTLILQCEETAYLTERLRPALLLPAVLSSIAQGREPSKGS